MPTFEPKDACEFEEIIVKLNEETTITIGEVSTGGFKKIMHAVRCIEDSDIEQAAVAIGGLFQDEDESTPEDILEVFDALPFAVFRQMLLFVMESVRKQLEGKDTNPTGAAKRRSRRSSGRSQASGRKKK
jgi:hypothetical protein